MLVAAGLLLFLGAGVGVLGPRGLVPSLLTGRTGTWGSWHLQRQAGWKAGQAFSTKSEEHWGTGWRRGGGGGATRLLYNGGTGGCRARPRCCHPSTNRPSSAALKSSPSKKGRGALLAVKPLGPTAAFSASQIPSEREDAQYDLRGARSYPTLEDEGEQAAGR